ncbi:DUF1778 domain-containing protein [Aetokthonos hydrillicola Thurmond2011]|jgi:uncharacterized protein (DUF1778 family)|uniref:DUF1778 domain-containing protein n=1 Tax=Aetokthonos hydrillicola Thurmond2011 TaxID=2712845 RepID=A0AAP5IFM6_9CYAN|nr:DUF1778 domain-containing protein [Aetokthonos hydrillicola]MBO3459775.1 DUF1778 domain-containing protein [Aetokthonos hydrillicola CCALA 1050]MBW4585208.1 DUF1778 domain-containing protein [Aetokthonos hydrillicola CCALA 1050]MDR9899544.1 DUF1778 domain-containing protein [Aetokthonos hydrillicola Thurmond2011]
MQPHSSPDIRTRPVNLRIREDVRMLIDRAAQAQSKSRSDFIIDAARRAAEDTLLDQTFVRVDEETYEHFLSVLDAPPENEGFARLMNVKKPWE